MARALASQTTHQYVHGSGYIEHATTPLPMPSGARRKADMSACLPPPKTAAATRHHLSVPGGGATKTFVWVEAERAWSMRGGHRMAYTADYLAAYGWTYVGPADDGGAE